MKYTIKDLIDNKEYNFSSKNDMLFFFRNKYTYPLFGAKFHADRFCQNINVTGKDTCANYFGAEPDLRRYLVTDELGRKIDVRIWADEVERAAKQPRPVSNQPAPQMGGVSHCHRSSQASMRRAKLRANSDDSYMDDICDMIESGIGAPAYVHVRKGNDDFLSDKGRFRDDRTWKKNKCRHQWQRNTSHNKLDKNGRRKPNRKYEHEDFSYILAEFDNEERIFSSLVEDYFAA